MRLDHEMKKREQEMLKTITDLKAENERLINMTTKDNHSLTKDLEPVPPSITQCRSVCIVVERCASFVSDSEFFLLRSMTPKDRKAHEEPKPNTNTVIKYLSACLCP